MSWRQNPYIRAGELLQQAHAVLSAMQPAFSARFHCQGVAFLARFDYPGRVSVYERNTGELIVRSRPGRPTEVAKSTARRVV